VITLTIKERKGYMKYKFIISTIILFLFPISVYAIEWVRTYGVGMEEWEEEMAYSIQQTTDGGYIVAGRTYSSVIEEYGMWILKLDENGNVVWQKIYGVSDEQVGFFAISIQQTTDGGYIVAGSLHSYVTERKDMWILKLDENGDVIWQKTYGVSDTDEYAMSIQQTSDGGYIVAGSFGFPASGFGTFLQYLQFGDAWVLKLDESGNVVWQKTYGRSGEYGEGASSIQQTTDGGYIVAGYTVSFGAGECDMWVLKLDENGNVVWQKAYGGQDAEGAMSVRQTADGGYIVAGATRFSFGAGIWDMLILKLDSSGNVSWSKTYGGENWEYATAIQQTTDGGYIVVGDTTTFGVNGNDHVWLLKLDSSGNISWENSYGTGDVDEGSFVRQTADGGYIVAGGTMSFGVNFWDIWVLKLNSNGEIPGCNITYPSHAIITEPSLSVTDTDVIAQPSNATILSTGALPHNTSAGISIPCEAAPPTCSTWSDVVAKFREFMRRRVTFRDVIKCFLEFRKERIT
jgi:hypothetical protein